MPREISAGAVVFRTTRRGPEFLLLDHGEGHWDFPKGNIETSEKEEQTVRREIAEETGIKRLKFIKGFRESIKYSYDWKGTRIFKIVIFYLVQTRVRKVTISNEHEGFAWLTFNGAIKRLTFSNGKQVLKKAQKKIEESQ